MGEGKVAAIGLAVGEIVGDLSTERLAFVEAAAKERKCQGEEEGLNLHLKCSVGLQSPVN